MLQPPLLDEDLTAVAERLATLAGDLRGARILLTGATGFIGTWLVESFLRLDSSYSLGAQMTVLTRAPGRYAAQAPHLATDPRLVVCSGGLDGQGSLEGLSGITHVIHAGSDVDRRMTAAEALAALATLDQGTEELLCAARSWPIKRFLYLSSAAVYGRPQGVDEFMEDSPFCPAALGPGSTYGLGKRIAELRVCLHAASSGFIPVIARLGAFYGPRLPMDGAFAAGNFFRDALAGNPIRVLGDGTAVRCYQYAADLSVWLWTLLLRGQAGAIFNVGGDTPISIREFAERVDQERGAGVHILGQPDPTRPVDRYCPSVKKAMEQLGLENRIGLADGIRRTIQWASISSTHREGTF